MANPMLDVDYETLTRFDRPGPRYTSYPTAVEFHDGVDGEVYAAHLAAADAKAEEPLSLYVHLPFCHNRCRFCGCHVVATPHEQVAARYLTYLEREVAAVAAHLPRRRQVAQLHWGGGTPTYLSPDQLTELHGVIGRSFALQPGAEVAIEVDPRATTEAHLDRLAELGFNRLSMGVQDFTPAVQEAIGRHQTFEETAELMAHARRAGFTDGINLDLIYGLPRQTEASFRDNLERVVGLAPDRLAIYSFAYVPWMKSNQRLLDPEELPSPELKLRLYLTALERLLEAGYEPIGMDHFALPGDELAVAARQGRLARNFMGYTVKPATASVAFGISGIGDLASGYFQNAKKLSTYYAALDDGRLPVERGYELDDDDRLRRFVITQLMCNFRLDKAAVEERFGVDFDDYFAAALAQLDELEAAGFVQRGDGELAITPRGRLFVRNAAMPFDRYLAAKLAAAAEKPVFSRTV